MKYKSLIAAAGLALLAFAPHAAKADAIVGYTNGSVDLLAGPADTYPSVAHVDMGANVQIMGCVDGLSWCDVAWNGNRGWINGHFLDSIYNDRHVNVVEYNSTRHDVPVVVFEQKAYWDNYYHDRPFYTEHRYWTTTTTTP